MRTLADKLRMATAPAHRLVEHTAFVRDLLAARIEQPAYCLLLRNLHLVYTALETALQRHAAHRSLAPLHSAALWRCAPLTDDLVFLHGPGWQGDLPALPAAMDYADRLQALDRDDPALLVAHAYVRYLGDLSGGQLVRRAVTRAFGLDGRDGIAFYDFGPPETASALALQLRNGLAALTDDIAQHAAIVDEAVDAFGRHERLFDALDRARALLPR